MKAALTWLAAGLVLSAVPAAAAPGAFTADIDGALARSKKEKKPLLIDFYGIWCPPCNELEETVFESAAFLHKSKSFTLLAVDADSKQSWKIKDRYKVGGYPTVVFANPQGKEIYRVVGYRNPREFLRVMDLVLAAKGKDLDRACKSKDAEDLWRCAVTCAERKEPCAEEAYRKLEGKLEKGSARYQLARTHFAETAATPDLKRDGFERLMAELPKSPLAMTWAASYLELFEEGSRQPAPKKELIEAVLAQSAGVTSDPLLDEAGLTPTDMAELRADLLGKLGRKEEAAQAWKVAAAELEKAAKQLPAGAPARGFTIERITCLEQAGETEAALKLARDYAAKYSNEFTFHFQAASLLNRAKRYNDAIPIARMAYAASYGDNKIRAATLLIDLYATIPDKEAAKKVHDEVTADVRPDAGLQVRTHRYLKKLDEAWKKVTAR